MTIYLYLATAAGLFIVALTDGSPDILSHTLKDHALTSVAVSEGTIAAGSVEGIWRSDDNGKTWNKSNRSLSIRHVRWMSAIKSSPRVFLAGTEPAGIFVSRDGAQTWHMDPKITQMRDKNGWFLPYSSGAGCVRGFAVSQSGPHPERIYAAVEVGGVLVSDDKGLGWRLVEGSDGKPDMGREFKTMIHPDVHSISVHPSSSNLLTATTGGGLFKSTNGGRSWENIYPCYIRAAWVDPDNAKHIIAGPADGVSRNGRIEESHDGGVTWLPASGGMNAPWPGHMVERFFQADKNLFAILSNGQLWQRPLYESHWIHVLPEIDSVNAVASIN